MAILLQGTEPTLLSMQNKVIERSSLVEFKKGTIVTEFGSTGIEILIISSGVLGVWDRNETTEEMRLVYPAWRNTALNIIGCTYGSRKLSSDCSGTQQRIRIKARRRF